MQATEDTAESVNVKVTLYNVWPWLAPFTQTLFDGDVTINPNQFEPLPVTAINIPMGSYGLKIKVKGRRARYENSGLMAFPH